MTLKIKIKPFLGYMRNPSGVGGVAERATSESGALSPELPKVCVEMT
jgi:hypothetical protein